MEVPLNKKWIKKGVIINQTYLLTERHKTLYKTKKVRLTIVQFHKNSVKQDSSAFQRQY